MGYGAPDVTSTAARRLGVVLWVMTATAGPGAGAAVGSAGSNDVFHTEPACWDGPRVFHTGVPPAELANRVHLIEVPATVTPPGEPAPSPNGAYAFWVRNPDTTGPGPWGAGLIVDVEQAERLALVFDDIAQPIQPRWINEKLIFVRAAWGRIAFSDLILDVEKRELVYHERAVYGQAAFEQAQQARGGRCPCEEISPPPADQPANMPAASPGPDALIGLLTLPSIFGPPETGGVVPATQPVPVPVYDAPTAGARKLGEPGTPEVFEFREYTYEGAAAVVYAERPGWYQIGLADGSRAWLSATSIPYGCLVPAASVTVCGCRCRRSMQTRAAEAPPPWRTAAGFPPTASRERWWPASTLAAADVVTPMKRRNRALCGLVLTVGLAGGSFALGAVVAARCCVADGSGLAGPAIVVGYGLIAAALGLLAGIGLGFWLPPRALRIATAVSGTVGAVVFALLGAAYLQSRADTRSHLEQAYAALPAFRLTLTHAHPSAPAPFRRVAVDWGERRYLVEDGRRSCSTALSGAQAVAMLGALRQVEAVMLEDPFPCAGTLGAELHELTFFVPEGTPPNTEGTLRLTAACLERHPGLRAPVDVVGQLHQDNGWPDGC